MARYCPEGFYVYLHIRKSDGLVFYVGKGYKYRAWDISDVSRPNTYWRRTKYKHGIEVKIYKEGMSNDCALTLEKIMIAKYRYLGHPLTNMTDGGEGVVGLESANRMPVNCSNGMNFESMASAADWLRLHGHPSANSSKISQASCGGRGTAYGFSWWRNGDDPKVYVDHYKYRCASRRKRVYCSNGMNFDQASEASAWITFEHGIEAHPEHIRRACLGKHDVIHGYKWSYQDIFDGDWEYSPVKRAVMCSNGMRFESVSDAARWVETSCLGKCSSTSISRACAKPEALCYGLAWWYDGEPEKIPSDPIEVIRRKASIAVIRSDGVKFESATKAAISMRDEGHPKAVASAICRAVKNNGRSAYGFKWKYADE